MTPPRYDLVSADGARVIREDGRSVLEVIGTASDDAARLTSALNRVALLERRLVHIEIVASLDG